MKHSLKHLFIGLMILSGLYLNSCSNEEDPQPEVTDPPTIDAGEDIIGITSNTSSISITASDPNGDALTINWSITTSPDGSSPLLNVLNDFNAEFTTDIAGLYEITVEADDMTGGTATDMVTLYIGGLLPTSISSNTNYPDLFQDPDIPDYYALSDLQATAGVTLEPGVVIENGSDVRLWFNGSSAFLSAQGTTANPIIFRGQQQVPGFWRAIAISSNNAQNVLDNVQIMHTGSSDRFVGRKTGIYLQSNVPARISITNTSISQSDGYGLYSDGNSAIISAFAANNFSNNNGAPLRIGAENLYVLDKNSTYENNTIQAIEVASAGNTNARFDNSGTIPAQAIPYHFLSSAELRAQVTFEAGTTCLFDAGKRLWVTSQGSIIANGTATERIILDGLTDAPGAWLGIELQSSTPANLINEARISNGGNIGGRGANIYMFGSGTGSQLTITNSTISNSQTYGIRTAPGSIVLNQSGNTFSNNASGDIRQD